MQVIILHPTKLFLAQFTIDGDEAKDLAGISLLVIADKLESGGAYPIFSNLNTDSFDLQDFADGIR